MKHLKLDRFANVFYWKKLDSEDVLWSNQLHQLLLLVAARSEVPLEVRSPVLLLLPGTFTSQAFPVLPKQRDDVCKACCSRIGREPHVEAPGFCLRGRRSSNNTAYRSVRRDSGGEGCGQRERVESERVRIIRKSMLMLIADANWDPFLHPLQRD